VTLIGVAGTTLWRSEALEVLTPGEQMYVGDYALRLDGSSPAQGPNYQAARANITVLRPARPSPLMHPERRIFPAVRQETRRPPSAPPSSPISISRSAISASRRWTVRAYVNPLAPFHSGWRRGHGAGGLASLWAACASRGPLPDAAMAPAE